MAYDIKFTAGADKEIDEIKARMNKKTGQKFVADVYEHAYTVSMHPKIGKQVEGTQFRQIVLTKNRSLFYKLEGETVIIASVFDTRQDPDKRNL